jgi:hypothetical protein
MAEDENKDLSHKRVGNVPRLFACPGSVRVASWTCRVYDGAASEVVSGQGTAWRRSC